MEEVKIIKTAEVLSNQVFNVYGTVEESLFLAKDVADLLGERDGYTVTRKVDEDEKVKLYCKLENKAAANRLFVTKMGITQIVSSSEKISLHKKREILIALGFDCVAIKSRPEIEFLDSVKIILSQLNINLSTQENIDGYKLDGYIPELNIAIEYDEFHHDNKKNMIADKERQDYITNKIGCKFIRCNIRDSKDYNIGLVVKAIMSV